MRWQGSDFHSVHYYAPAIRLEQAADHVEERGLASAIGPDQRNQLPRLDVETHVANGRDSSEAFPDIFSVKQHFPLHVLRAR